MFQYISTPKSTSSEETIILEEEIKVQQTKPYVIGINCHSKFIQVNVYIKSDLKFLEYRHEFLTDRDFLIYAKNRCIKVLTN